MKNKHILFIAVFLVIIGVGIVWATSHSDSGRLVQTDSQELDHNKNEDPDEIDNDKHDEDVEIHDESEDNDDHGEESGIVEMTQAQQKEIGLTISIAHPGDIERILTLVGEVRLNEDRMAHLVPRVPGIVSSVFASLGDQVSEGQVLATIDSHELTELKADYIEKLRNSELTRSTFERKKYLQQENIASKADWLEAESAFKNAATILRSAKRRLVVLGMNEKDILDLPNAKDESFGIYELRSPIPGTIISKHITRGEKISEQEAFTVADLSVLWVDLQIPAKDLGRVKKGLHIEISSTEGWVAEETLDLIGPIVSEETRTTLGRVVLHNPEGLWKPGIFVKGQIHSETSSSAVVVPSTAVQNIDGEDVIFVPAGDGFKPVDVMLGKSIKDKTEIMAGLKSGDRYVNQGAFELKAVIVTSGTGGHAGHGH